MIRIEPSATDITQSRKDEVLDEYGDDLIRNFVFTDGQIASLHVAFALPFHRDRQYVYMYMGTEIIPANVSRPG